MSSTVYPLSQLSSAELNGTYWQPILPELYALKTTVENSSGHDHQDVLTHTIGVMAGMEEVIQAEFLPAAEREALATYLDQRIVKHTRLELLRLAVVIHDLMKSETILTDAQGNTHCPAHEILAVAKVPTFQARFDLEPEEVTRVQKIVLHHGSPHALLELCLAKPIQEAALFNQFSLAVGEAILEIVILVYADNLGSDAAEADPIDFAAREQLCQSWIHRLVRSA